ncbi:phosphotransferase enzyme family protein [Beauveria brongniartii RCEF 3172]|uniref:Phosphotransferase enzyme family protein n=1 Tax=Beauveria brongniartii RCEF 3172 TaxID=1081107 RepID=A0A167EL56_9HYPO|nr:phosphotransferase enzyme family protein [Beauveria brongniartii RCEF 3172]
MAVLDCLAEPPFFAPALQLPATLPSPEDIESCNKVIKEGYGRRIIHIGEHFIVKYGTRVSVMEGQNLLYVKKTKTVPIPEVYALYTKLNLEGKTVTYIIMEYIRGETLETAWPKLSPDEKRNVALELRDYFDELRKVPAPGYFGCFGNPPCEDSVFWTLPCDDAAQNAPLSRSFRTEHEFNQGLVEVYLDNRGTEENARFYDCMFSEVLKDHRAVLTHADLQKDNIILKKDKSLFVIDWEAAGWYPEYWESCAATLAAKLSDDFWNYLVIALDEYPTESAWLNPMIRELW